MSGSVCRRGGGTSVADYASTLSAVVMSAIPVFVLAYLLKQVTGVYAFQHNWPDALRLPPIGIGPKEWYLGLIPSLEQLKYLIQPALILASVSTAIVARLTRTTVLEASTMDHVRTARSKGLHDGEVGAERHVVRQHARPS